MENELLEVSKTLWIHSLVSHFVERVAAILIVSHTIIYNVMNDKQVLASCHSMTVEGYFHQQVSPPLS